MHTKTNLIKMAVSQLEQSATDAGLRDQFEALADMKRISALLQEPTEPEYSQHTIEQLQSKIHAITGDGEIMGLFNGLLGVGAGS